MMKAKAIKFCGFLSSALFALCTSAFAEVLAQNTDQIYEAMQKGEDVALVKGKVYEVNKPIRFQKDGQRLYTKDAARISDYAVLRVTKPEGGQVLNGNGKNDIVVERVLVDGNRYNLPPYEGGGHELAWFGGNGAHNQTIRNCVFMNSRTWSTFKLHEGGKNCKIENSILFGCGADSRGNGRYDGEVPPKWGDGISCAAEGSTVSNNIVIDPTDVGVVIFCAPNTEVKNNVIASISRESLGGINMVDGLGFYEIDKGKIPPEDKKSIRKYNYSGVYVHDNLIDSRGARVHIAVPMGATVWVPRDKTTQIFTGAVIQNNTLDGDASAYGFIADGVENFQITGNKALGKVSGLADGRWDVVCDDPAPFLYNPKYVENTKLQKDFKPMQRSLQHLLRCNHGPIHVGGPFRGYKAYSYGKAEAKAVTETAFIEMLGRLPTAKESDFYSRLLNEHSIPADQLRWELIKTPEFKAKFGEISRNKMHKFRTQRWISAFDKIIGESQNYSAQDVYKKALKSLTAN